MMEQTHPAVEATLLSRETDLPDLAPLKAALLATLASSGQRGLEIEQITPVFHLIETEHAQVLLALGNEPLPIDGFAGAMQPEGGVGFRGDVLEALTQARSSATVIVLPHPDLQNAPQDHPNSDLDLLRDLCWRAVECLYAHLPVDLVFWEASETLFTPQDFEWACTHHAAAMTDTPSPSSQPPLSSQPLPSSQPPLSSQPLPSFQTLPASQTPPSSRSAPHCPQPYEVLPPRFAPEPTLPPDALRWFRGEDTALGHRAPSDLPPTEAKTLARLTAAAVTHSRALLQRASMIAFS